MLRVRACAYLFGLAGLIAAPVAAAAQEPICAGRPGLASGTCTVPAGQLQLETGIADWSRDRHAGVRSTELVLGSTDVKYGLTGSSHLELGVVPYLRLRPREGTERETASGFGDLTIRYLHRLTADDAKLAVAAYPFLKIPTARRSIGNGALEGGIIVPLEFELADSPLAVTISPEIAWVSGEDGSGYHLRTVQVAGVTAQLTRRFSVAGEFSAGWDRDPAGTNKQALAGLSAAFLVNDDLQLDGGANLGLNRAAPDLQLYVGLAKRFKR